MAETVLDFLNIDIQKNYFGVVTGKPINVEPYRFSAKGLSIKSPIKLKLGQEITIKIIYGDHTLKNIPGKVINTKATSKEYNYGLIFTFNDLPKSATRGIKTVLHKLEIDINPKAQLLNL